MPRMIADPRQILDQQRDARQRPEIGLITLSRRTSQQRGGYLLCLLGRQFRLGSRWALAGQGRLAAVLPCLFPAICRLPGNAQPAGHLGGGNFLCEEFAGLQAPFFHFSMVSRLSHAQL